MYVLRCSAVKDGGLADVIGALPAAQIAEGIDTRVLLPAFPDIRRGVVDAQVVTRRIPSPGGSRCCTATLTAWGST
ncbi:glycogen synthase [Klebsiella pneumoniae subsp. pneumoniae]|uniref:starch synthase n=1 Tax=Klebsiella pneumoniae subsp. pneumoniae TaxID=72407 RepID=A0A377Z140_KLEPN|nr:glycogen synthase [Klebsiella pneumoniae subsp. pneumoniae]